MVDAVHNGRASILSGIGAFSSFIVALIALFLGVSNQSGSQVKDTETRIDAQMERFEKRIEQQFEIQRKRIEESLTKSEHEAFQKRIDAELSRIDGWLVRAAQSSVTKDEHNKDLMNAEARVATLRGIVEEIQRQFTGSYNIGKQLDQVNAQITLLQNRIDALKTAPKTDK